MAAEAETLGRSGMAALSRGDGAAARTHFEALCRLSPDDGDAHLALAMACRMQGDAPATLAAAHAAAALAPDSLRATLLKADALAELGDVRGAIGCYGAVLALAGDPAGLPADARREIARAEAAHGALTRRLVSHLEARLAEAGYDPATAPPRFASAFEMMAGRQKRHESRPRSFYMPGLPTIEFFDRAHFAWLDTVEAATDAIEHELRGLLQDPAAFAPYIEAEAEEAAALRRPGAARHGLLGREDWSAAYLWRDGARVDANADRCPATLAALRDAPLEQVPGRAPFVLFSKLAPGAWIRPHHGFLNSRLVCHLPLIVPPGCWFRVGNTRRGWERGKAFVFDDTIGHEARNEGSATRVVLIFNIWHPMLSKEERALVTALLEATDALSG